MFSKRLLIALVLAMLALAGPAPAQTIPRIDQDFVKWTQDTIDGNHPPGSNGYADLDDLGLAAAAFRSAAEAFLAEDWSGAGTLADAVDYDVAAFRDTATGETYYGLLPEADNGDGRGFFFLRPRAGVQRRLVLEAAHAVEDNRTGVLASEIFRASGARALLLSGADRCASDEESGCTGTTDCGNHRVSDAAHSVDTFFHIFHELASVEHGDTLTLQIHGFKADGTDPEFSVSDGTETNNGSDSYLPNAFYLDLQARMVAANPGLTRNGNSCNSSLTGQGDFQCGTQNVQGRHLNGSPEACGTEASSASGRFVHLEMSNDLREPGDLYSQQLVIDAVNAVFPRKAEAGDLIWADLNNDGIRQSTERGVHGATVEVLDASDDVVESTTSVVGGYRIGNLDPGTYRLRVQLPSGYSAGTGFDVNGRALATFTVTAGQSLLTVDAPLVPPAVGQVGDRVWNDADRDGLQDTGESGLGSVSVRLLTADDVTVATQSTSTSGLYTFTGVLPGDYKVSVVPGTRGFTKRVTGSPNTDSDVDPLTGASAAFGLAGVIDLSRDAGLATCFDIPLVARNASWLWKTGEVSWPSDWNQASSASLTGWAAGYAPFGFGDGTGIDFETAVPDPTGNGTTGIFTTYFRHSFQVDDTAMFSQPLQLTFKRNDGVVIYLNGVEVVRRNLPWGAAASPGMPASTEATATETIAIPPSLLVSGTNVIAVELHEVTPEEDDLGDLEGVFDLTLTGKSCDCRLAEVSLNVSDTTYLEEDAVNDINGGNTTAGVAGDPADEEVALLRWQTTGLPADAEVVSAEIILNMTSVVNASGVSFRVWPVLRSWNEGQTTWVNAATGNAWATSGAKGGTDRDLTSPVGLMTLRTTGKGSIPLSSGAWGLIESWADGAANNGFVIGDTGPNGEINFSSDETSTTANRPVLRVIYRKPACQ
jgi:hypothetical protein